MQKTLMNLFARLRAAFSRASASQWVAYIIVMIAIVILIYVIVDRIQSPQVTEPYIDKSIKKNQSKNCSEKSIGVSDGDPGCSDTSLEKCNKITFDKTAEYDNNLTIMHPDNADKLTSGMESIKFCSNSECSKNRSLQDVVNEYKYYHIPHQLHKININHEPIAEEFKVLMENRCKINNYIAELTKSNNKLQNQVNVNEQIIMIMRAKKQYIQNSLP